MQGIPEEHGIEDEVWQHFHEITCPVADLQVSLEVESLEHSRIPDFKCLRFMISIELLDMRIRSTVVPVCFSVSSGNRTDKVRYIYTAVVQYLPTILS